MLKGIFKNSLILSSSQLAVKIGAFFYTVFLADRLGVTNYGLYVAAISYFTIIASLGDFGVSRFLVREIAKDNSAIKKLLGNALVLRLSFIFVIYIVFTAGFLILDPDQNRAYLISIALLALFPQSIGATLDNIFIATGKFISSALGIIILNFSMFGMGIYFISSGFFELGAVLALIAAHMIFLLFLIIFYIKQIGGLNFGFDPSIVKNIFKDSFLYGLLGAVGFISFRADTLILSYSRGNFETGIYGFAYRFLETAALLPNAFAFTIFPLFSKFTDTNSKITGQIFWRISLIMMFFGIAVYFGFVIILPEFILKFIPKYISAIEPLKILALSIPLIFVHIIAAQLITSSGKYLKKALVLFCLILLFNIVFGIMIIPAFGYIGASWITVIGEFITLFGFLVFIKKLILKSN